jgi:hypothetical protein
LPDVAPFEEWPETQPHEDTDQVEGEGGKGTSCEGYGITCSIEKIGHPFFPVLITGEKRRGLLELGCLQILEFL